VEVLRFWAIFKILKKKMGFKFEGENGVQRKIWRNKLERRELREEFLLKRRRENKK
jgi:hypothetical protein